MTLYDEILSASVEEFAPEEYYSIPLKIKDLIKVYDILKTEDVEISENISNFLEEEYGLNLDFLLSTQNAKTN
jgi:hypothetical protein